MTLTTFRALRKSLGMTQAEVADLCGVGRTQVVAWEAGDPQPPLAAQRLLWACQRDPTLLVELCSAA